MPDEARGPGAVCPLTDTCDAGHACYESVCLDGVCGHLPDGAPCDHHWEFDLLCSYETVRCASAQAANVGPGSTTTEEKVSTAPMVASPACASRTLARFHEGWTCASRNRARPCRG